MNIYEFIDNKFSDDDMYRSNVARRGISRIAGKGVEQMQGGNRNREGGSMNKKSHEEELQEHINALEQKLEEEVKENIKHLGDLRYYEEVQIPELQEQLAEARAEIERKNEELDMFLAEQQAMNKIIARKDKLIEQMREALEWVLEGAIHDFHYVCQHRDNCLCWGCQKARIKATLAAERGE